MGSLFHISQARERYKRQMHLTIIIGLFFSNIFLQQVSSWSTSFNDTFDYGYWDDNFDESQRCSNRARERQLQRLNAKQCLNTGSYTFTSEGKTASDCKNEMKDYSMPLCGSKTDIFSCIDRGVLSCCFNNKECLATSAEFSEVEEMMKQING